MEEVEREQVLGSDGEVLNVGDSIMALLVMSYYALIEIFFKF